MQRPHRRQRAQRTSNDSAARWHIPVASCRLALLAICQECCNLFTFPSATGILCTISLLESLPFSRRSMLLPACTCLTSMTGQYLLLAAVACLLLRHTLSHLAKLPRCICRRRSQRYLASIGRARSGKRRTLPSGSAGQLYDPSLRQTAEAVDSEALQRLLKVEDKLRCCPRPGNRLYARQADAARACFALTFASSRHPAHWYIAAALCSILSLHGPGEPACSFSKLAFMAGVRSLLLAVQGAGGRVSCMNRAAL